MLRRLLTCSLTCLLTWVVSAHAAPSPRLLAPLDRSAVHTDHVLVVYTVPAQTRSLLQVNGVTEDRAQTSVPGNDSDLYHLLLPLAEGTHRVRILNAADESELLAFTITYAPHYSQQARAAQQDTLYRFHTRERENDCGDCHNLPEVYETADDQPLAPAGKVCGACHADLENSPYLHGPMAVYACFMCHEPAYAPARFRVTGSQASICGTCHEGFLARVLGGKKFVHGPVAAGSCIVCHDPHGGVTPTLVREAPPSLCLHCHADTLPVPLNRNLHGKVPCIDCHAPHGSAAPMLLAAEGNAFCGGCHADVAEMQSGHPIPGHVVSAEVDPSHPGRPFGCQSCHQAHGVRDVSKLNVQSNEAAQKEFCVRCHN